MIWFNVKKLERQLANEEVSESSSYQYLMIYLIILALVHSLPGEEEFTQIGWEIGDLILGLLIIITGTYLAFSINSRGRNIDFLKRYLSLSFVHSIRLVIVLLTFKVAYEIFLFVIPLDLWHLFNDLFSGDFWQLFYPMVTSLVFYALLIGSFKRINRTFNVQEAAA